MLPRVSAIEAGRSASSDAGDVPRKRGKFASGGVAFRERNQSKSARRLEHNGEGGCTTPAKPEVHRLALRLLVERRCRLVAGCHRNRNYFELKQPELRQRVQRKVAVLVYTTRHDPLLKIKQESRP